MKKSGIYKISSILKPKKIYIGSSVNIEKRIKTHIRLLKNLSHPNVILQNHVGKYGIEDLHFETIFECDPLSLIKKEQNYIDELEPYFNVCKKAGNQLGVKRTDRFKKLRSDNMKLRHKSGFKIWNEDTLRKVRGSNSKKSKKIICMQTGEIFDSIRSASAHFKVKYSTIHAQISGQNKNKFNLKYYE